jgi:hypothetical protein
MRMRRAFVVALLAAGVAACPAPADVTPIIHVDPRAARRLDWLGKPAGSSSEAAQPRAARVRVMKDGEQLGGPNAIGRPGDLLLENDEVVFVVDQLGSSSGFAETGGNLVDAADAHARKDELGQVFAYFGTFPRQGVYDTVTSGTDADGSAWIEARGKELYEPRLTVATRYTLHAPDRALLIETTLANEGDVPVELPSVGDAVQWGGTQKVAPGKRVGFKGSSSGPYVGGVGRFTSYALTSTEGALDAVSGGTWSDTAQRKGIKVPPHERTQYARVFVVGMRPDTSSLVGELTLASGQAVGTLKVTPTAVLPGMTVLLSMGPSTEPMTLAAPFEGLLPVGTYSVSLPGGAPVGPVQVKADGEAAVALPVPAPGGIDAKCTDVGGAAMPCKVTFEGQGSTPSPDFGPTHVAGPARNQATTADGVVAVTLMPGTYRLTASRGPEYTLAQTDVTVEAGARKPVVLAPRRVVDTWGYLGCDFHQHTMLGTDAPTSPRDRVISNVAEGVEVAVASEHNVVADLSPLVKEMHLEGELVALSGDELTTDASRHPWGHVNAWPIPRDPTRPRGGAPSVRDRLAKDVFDELRHGLTGDFVLQINHPRSGLNGYFDQLAFDPARGVGTGDGYDAVFDAVEIWNGRNAGPRARILEDWRALLRTGHPVTPTADTDTHGVVDQEAGYPRTYVRVSDDTQLATWDASRTADLVRGVKTLRDVVLTNGPMLRVTANGAPVGGLAKASGGKVTVKVHVECAPWVDVDTVRVLHVRDGVPEATQAARTSALKSGAVGADLTFTVVARSDDAIAVVASGSRPMSPVLSGDAMEITPWAMTGAIWIDADGDGKSLGQHGP